MATELSLTATPDRRLAWHRGGSVRFLAVTASATGGRSGPRPPLNLALAIDASGSMGGGKLDAAIDAATGVIDRLGEADRLTIVSFASDIVTHVAATAMDAPGRAAARAAVAALHTRGSTNLSEGWFTAVEAAARPGLPDPRVVILSDGHANAGIADASLLAEHAAGAGRARGRHLDPRDRRRL
jgi:Ca-activated chloride channel homolog